ncbi:MAG: hypothetical protein WDN30_14285 [Pararobbsia sp.]
MINDEFKDIVRQVVREELNAFFGDAVHDTVRSAVYAAVREIVGRDVNFPAEFDRRETELYNRERSITRELRETVNELNGLVSGFGRSWNSNAVCKYDAREIAEIKVKTDKIS